MKICTWNSQGDPTTSPEKTEILTALYDRDEVVMIQECGKMDNINRVLPPSYMRLVPQAGALNPRCSTCILSRSPLPEPATVYLRSGCGRSLISVTIFGVNIITLHADAGNGITDVVQALTMVKEPFILGADMNCTTEELSARYGGRTRILQISDRPPLYVTPSAPSDHTHPSSQRTLDFFIHSLSLTCARTNVYAKRGGDHYPVETEVLFAHR